MCVCVSRCFFTCGNLSRSAAEVATASSSPWKLFQSKNHRGNPFVSTPKAAYIFCFRDQSSLFDQFNILANILDEMIVTLQEYQQLWCPWTLSWLPAAVVAGYVTRIIIDSSLCCCAREEALIMLNTKHSEESAI